MRRRWRRRRPPGAPPWSEFEREPDGERVVASNGSHVTTRSPTLSDRVRPRPAERPPQAAASLPPGSMRGRSWNCSVLPATTDSRIAQLPSGVSASVQQNRPAGSPTSSSWGARRSSEATTKASSLTRPSLPSRSASPSSKTRATPSATKWMRNRELSSFQEMNQYYAQGVSVSTATLPEGWRERLVPFESPESSPTALRRWQCGSKPVASAVTVKNLALPSQRAAMSPAASGGRTVEPATEEDF